MDVDYERIAALLAIVAACADHSGKLGAISNVAMDELLGLNAKLRQDAMKARQEIESVAAVESDDEDDDETKSDRRI